MCGDCNNDDEPKDLSQIAKTLKNLAQYIAENEDVQNYLKDEMENDQEEIEQFIKNFNTDNDP